MARTKRYRDDDDDEDDSDVPVRSRHKPKGSGSSIGLLIGLGAVVFVFVVFAALGVGLWFLFSAKPNNAPGSAPNVPNLDGATTNTLRPIGVGDFEVITKETNLASLQSKFGPGEVVSASDRKTRKVGAKAAFDADKYQTLDDHGRNLGVEQWYCWKSGKAELYVATNKKGVLVAKLYYLREAQPTYMFEAFLSS